MGKFLKSNFSFHSFSYISHTNEEFEEIRTNFQPLLLELTKGGSADTPPTLPQLVIKFSPHDVQLTFKLDIEGKNYQIFGLCSCMFEKGAE